VESWGKPVDNTGRYDVVRGLLQSGDIEIAPSGLMIMAQALDVIDYAGETVIYE